MRPNGNCSPSLLCTHRFLPHLKGLGAQKTIIDRLHEVAAKAKEVLCEAMECQEFLGLPWGFEPSHRPFSLARRFVRDFGSIVRIDVVDVMHRGHDRTMSSIIASEFVSHQPPGRGGPTSLDRFEAKLSYNSLVDVMPRVSSLLDRGTDGVSDYTPHPVFGHRTSNAGVFGCND